MYVQSSVAGAGERWPARWPGGDKAAVLKYYKYSQGKEGKERERGKGGGIESVAYVRNFMCSVHLMCSLKSPGHEPTYLFPAVPCSLPSPHTCPPTLSHLFGFRESKDVGFRV